MKLSLQHWLTAGLLALALTACGSVETSPIHHDDHVSSAAAQTTTSPDAPPFQLTAEQLFAWSPSGPTRMKQTVPRPRWRQDLCVPMKASIRPTAKGNGFYMRRMA